MEGRGDESGAQADQRHTHQEGSAEEGCPTGIRPWRILMDELEQRLRRLVDPEMFHNDALYHAQISQFRSWLDAARMAMEDESIDSRDITRVLNRMVFGCPTGSEAHERLLAAEIHKEIIASSTRPLIIKTSERVGA